MHHMQVIWLPACTAPISSRPAQAVCGWALGVRSLACQVQSTACSMKWSAHRCAAQHASCVPGGLQGRKHWPLGLSSGTVLPIEEFISVLTAAQEDAKAWLKAPQSLCGCTTSIWDQLSPQSQQDSVQLPQQPLGPRGGPRAPARWL